jgi:hypothetical protein
MKIKQHPGAYAFTQEQLGCGWRIIFILDRVLFSTSMQQNLMRAGKNLFVEYKLFRRSV